MVQMLQASALVAAIVMATFYPFLPGDFDSAAEAISTGAQVFTMASLLLAPLGLLWLLRARRHAALPSSDAARPYRGLLPTTGIVALLVVALSALGVWAGGSAALALAVLLAAAGVARSARAHASRLVREPATTMRAATIYLIFAPVAALAAHLTLAGPATSFSRERAMDHAGVLIAEIERHRNQHQAYPQSLVGLWPDYATGVVGIERFGYSRHGSAYTLSFEQPGLLFPNLGTIEVGVYNPQGEHLYPSHAAWNLELPLTRLITRQGWHTSHRTDRHGWRYFWFD